MTDQERQRQMDFIVNTLAGVSTRLDVLTEKVDGLANVQAQTEKERKASELERKADAVRTSRLEDAFVSIKKLSERMSERLDDHQSRVESVEEAIVSINKLSERLGERLDEHQSRIVDFEGAIVILTKLLNSGGNGTS